MCVLLPRVYCIQMFNVNSIINEKYNMKVIFLKPAGTFVTRFFLPLFCYFSARLSRLMIVIIHTWKWANRFVLFVVPIRGRFTSKTVHVSEVDHSVNSSQWKLLFGNVYVAAMSRPLVTSFTWKKKKKKEKKNWTNIHAFK